MNFEKFIKLILDNEEILMEKTLKYAKERDYVKYTSTLVEAWRLSISGLSESICAAFRRSDKIPELTSDQDYRNSPIAEYGVLEAKKHRSRGITLIMFLGLMKYYQQSYIDLVNESDLHVEEKNYFTQYIKRYFDNVELGFIAEWTTTSEKDILHSLQETNRDMTNEKNKYLTIFESIYDPIVLFDKNNKIENINHQAAETYTDLAGSGMKYYSDNNTDMIYKLIKKELDDFVSVNNDEISIEKTIDTKKGPKTFMIKFKKMMDISEKYSGTVVTFHDVTARLEFERQLKEKNEKLAYYARIDYMTNILNRRTGLIELEEQLIIQKVTKNDLSVCFIDLDKLKDVNDLYGHLEGDDMIKNIVNTFKSLLSSNDFILRLGGDEFVMILPNSDYTKSERLIRKVQKKLALEDTKNKKPYQNSFSYGIVDVKLDNIYETNDIIKLADEKMYHQKTTKKAQHII